MKSNVNIKLKEFLEKLSREVLPANVFNPWQDYDTLHDENQCAPQVRTDQLGRYLSQRINTAQYLLLAEGLSYQGGKFTGIAMTSERIVLGYHEKVPPRAVLEKPAQRTSRRDMNRASDKLGFTEPTASMVWQAILQNKIPPEQVVLWNIFPWHPFKKGNMLSNRTPTKEELLLGLEYFRNFRELFSQCKIICLGKKSGQTLESNGEEVAAILRHPANGGAREFNEGLREFFNI